ncbi:Sm domain-containing protein [Caenorhabditis elegans]|uniref:Sm domain-containing protein n=2 Tax=Caenorhabditis elegans TaxID=6239 RepID=Q9BL76_CAEEL|nr:Sm domain-containing protein [Caenorhabditis elegans]CCD71728.1 Sm domain-containing protein [Caenorhabditis elegans]|eukprot:NP_490671.2 Uncharacterized protein CELE_Y48G1C.9 [Caenorhabditis elegans]
MCDDQSTDLIQLKGHENAKKSEAHLKVLEYIGKRYEIRMTDGRYIRGTMIATDKDANMVFNKADERWDKDPQLKGVRFLGQAMISKKHVESMHALPDPKETEI